VIELTEPDQGKIRRRKNGGSQLTAANIVTHPSWSRSAAPPKKLSRL
jgi:hypothetical protein